MKTKPLFRYTITYSMYFVLLFCTAFAVKAQCPTISDQTPSPICNASGFTFNDLNAYATDGGNGITWYNTSTGGTPFSTAQLVSEGTYYVDDSSGTCGTRISLTIDFQVDESGQNLDGIYCSNENPTVQTYIDNVLQANIPIGGSVEVYNDFNLTMQANGTDAIPGGATNYFVVFVDNLGCKSQLEIGSTAIFVAPTDPTPSSPQLFCADTNPTLGDIEPGTTDSHSWYENIDGSGNPIPPALLVNTALVDGHTYYVQVDDFFCDSNPIPVTVNVDIPVEPGTSAVLDYCMDSVPTSDFNLFDELGGSPVITGTWSGPLVTSNGHMGTVNISTLTTPGVYTFSYTVASNGACPQGNSSVTITVFDIFTSGIPSANNPSSFCEKDLPSSFDLFTLLDNEDPNGQWTQGTTSSDPIVASPFDLTGLAPGTHNFTYTQNVLPNPCLEESTTIQIIVLQDPNAGNAVNQTFCENDLVGNSPFDLFNALDGSQDNNSGTWRDASDATVSRSIDITGFTVEGSPYSFNYTIDNGTCIDTETILITVEPAPESGNAMVPVEICEEDTVANSPFDLFSLLDGTQDNNGTWYIGTDTSGPVATNPVDISAFTDGTYNYTYSVPVIGTCSDVDVTVQIIVLPQPETGTPIGAVFCENDLVANSPLDLFGQLSGADTGGTWTDDNTSGALTGSNVDLTNLSIGSYNFTYTISAGNGCSNSSTVVITVEPAPESGNVLTPFEICAAEITSAQTYDLFDLLEGEDQTGVWFDDDSSGTLSGNLVTIDGLSQGTYHYTFDVNAIGSCDDDLVTVSIIINDTPPPTVSSSQSFCDAGTVGDITVIGTGIQWYDQLAGGTPLTGSIDLTDGGTYYASQTDPITGCESSLRALVTATINQTPVSGSSGSPVTECNNNNNIDLFTALDGSQDAGGVWQDTDGTGSVIGNIFDATGITPGTYQFTYYVAASAPCVDVSTIISIAIESPLDAGTDNVLDVCSNTGTTDLFTLLGGADTGGTWSPTLTSGTGVFDPLLDSSGTYTYSLTNACGTETSDVVVTVTQPANAGTDAPATICIIDGITDLFTFLGGADTGGTWSPALTSGTGEFDPTVDVDGVYTYTVTTTAPCLTDASAQITVTIEDSTPPVAININPEFCLDDNPTVADLDGVISSPGTLVWYADAAQTTVLSASDSLIDGEDYFGTQSNSSSCESSSNTQINVTINDVATPTLINSNLELCINDNPSINDLTLNITEYNATLNNVVWYDSATNGSLLANSTILETQITYYAALYDAITGCESSVRLQVIPDLTSCGKLILPDGFSPNGDGTNDTYDYNNLDVLYPNFEMEIYNRYGSIIYRGNASTPRFNGKSNQSGTLGKGDLPVGVYFYVFNYNDGTNKPEQGRLYLSR